MAEPARQDQGFSHEELEPVQSRPTLRSIQGGGEGGEAPNGRHLSAVPSPGPEEPAPAANGGGRPNLRLIQGGKSGGDDKEAMLKKAADAGAADTSYGSFAARKGAKDIEAGKDPGKATSRAQGLSNRIQGAGSFISKNRKAFLAGGGIAGAVLSAVFGFLALLPLRLESMMKNITEKRVTNIAERSVESQTEKLVEGYASEELAASAGSETAAAAEADAGADVAFDRLLVTNGSLRKTLYRTWRVNKFATKLAKDQGIVLKRGAKFGTLDYYKDGQLIGNLGSKDARRIINAAIRQQTKWWQFLKRAHLRRWFRNALGVQLWKFFKGEKDPDAATKEVRGNLVDAAAAEDSALMPKIIDDAMSGDSHDNSADQDVKDGIKASEEAAADAVKNADVKASSGILRTIFVKTLGEQLGSKLATIVAKAAGPLIIIGIVDIMARINHFLGTGGADESLAKLHQFEYAAQFAQWNVANDQAKDGTTPDGKKVTGPEVNALMNQAGDPAKSCGFQQLYTNKVAPNCQSVTTTNDGTDNFLSRSPSNGIHTFAEMWNIGMALAVTPVGPMGPVLYAWYYTGGKVMDVINAILGAALSVIGKAAEAIIPGLAWLMEHIATWSVDMLMKLLLPAVTGAESDADLFNGLDAGGASTGQFFMHDIGAPPVDATTAMNIQQEIADNQAINSAHLSLKDRLFSTDYSQSFVNRLALAIPASPSDAVNQTESYVASMFTLQWVRTLVASIPLPGLHLATAANNVDLYHLQHYDFTDEQLKQPVDDAGMDQAVQAAAKRLNKDPNTITPDDVDHEQDCPDTGDDPNYCKLGVTALQTLYAGETNTDNGGIGSGDDNSGDNPYGNLLK